MRIGFWLLLPMLIGPVLARDVPLSVGYSFVLHSQSLEEDRLVTIFLPDGYEETTARYPVLYLLDAETHLLHAGSSARLLAQLGEMPRIIVVGVANTDRVRDMTPPPTRPNKDFPGAGGSAKFLTFLRSELKPYVQSHLRTEPFSILAGTSLSGLFVMNAFAVDPESFNAYFAASPSLWWDEGHFSDQLLTALQRKVESRPEFLFISLAGGDSESLQGNTRRVLDALGQRGKDALMSQQAFFSEESHNSTPLRSFYGALRWLYSGWRPASASSLADLRQHYEALSKRYGYSVTIPDAEINYVAYGLLFSGHKPEAIDLFMLNTRNSPGSANAWDSLGEAHRLAGDLKSSVVAYRKACALGRQHDIAHSAEYCSNLESVNRQIKSGQMESKR